MIDSSLPPHTKILNCNKYNDREKKQKFAAVRIFLGMSVP